MSERGSRGRSAKGANDYSNLARLLEGHSPRKASAPSGVTTLFNALLSGRSDQPLRTCHFAMANAAT